MRGVDKVRSMPKADAKQNERTNGRKHEITNGTDARMERTTENGEINAM